jgi:O-antigen/teichoic acid export membrane protein
MSYTVAQNTTFLTAASILQKVISFFYFILIARVMGVENTGQYFFAITFTTIFTVAADFGFNQVLTRETARYPEKTSEFFNTAFWTKLIFGIFTYGLVVLLVNALGYPVATKTLIYLSAVTMFFDNLQSSFFSIFRAKKNLIFESIAVVGSQLVTLVIGTTAIVCRWPLIWLIAAYTIPSFLANIYGAYFVRKYYQCKLSFLWDKNVFKWFLPLAVPFAIAGILGRLYSYSDSLLMSKMLTVKELGWWSVPYKIVFAFQFIPVALSASVYPVFSSLFITEKTALGPLFEKSWRYLFAIIFPLAFGIMVIAGPFISLVYGSAYQPSVAPLRLLIISLIFGYLAFITGALLNATNKQKIQTGLVAVSLAVNVILNLILLPRLRLEGAAIAAICSNFILCVAGFYFSRKQAVIDMRKIIRYAVQTILPAGIMAACVYLLTRRIHWIAAVPAGAILYLILLFVSGFLKWETVMSVKNKIWPKH